MMAHCSDCQLFLSGLPPIGECTLPGPTIFAPASGTVIVAAGATVYVPTTVQVPLPGPNQESCYQMTVDVPASGDRFHCQGSFEGLGGTLCHGGPRWWRDHDPVERHQRRPLAPGQPRERAAHAVLARDGLRPGYADGHEYRLPDKTSGTLPIAPGGSVNWPCPFGSWIAILADSMTWC